jgi:hypothetical protein
MTTKQRFVFGVYHILKRINEHFVLNAHAFDACSVVL